MKSLTVSCLALAVTTLAWPALAQVSVLYDSNSSAGPVESRVLLYKNALYGTTLGYGNDGSVFELRHVGNAWKASTIAAFDGTDGAEPMAGLIADSSGNLYGTTFQGGTYNTGTVFKLTRSGGVWPETVLYSFTGHSDGERPNAGLVMNSSGALFGTTLLGGGSRNGTGVGTVFELQSKGATWTETVLHAFGNG